jgi:Holliday junction resolvase RusA-like endonuclease
MNTIDFMVHGDPKAQPRPRAFARKFANGAIAARMYDAGTAEGWKGLIALAARPHKPAAPIEGPIRVDVDFFFARPQRLLRRRDPEEPIPHDSKPDRDNLDKAVLDALTQLGFWRDDAQVCAGEVRKFYVSKTGSPHAKIRIEATDPVGAEVVPKLQPALF